MLMAKVSALTKQLNSLTLAEQAQKHQTITTDTMERRPKAMFFNGSPRKNKNTADMLQSAMKGAQEAGAETELVHLYDIDFKGCKSCFACKVKNSKCNGICALKDDLRPVLERARHPR